MKPTFPLSFALATVILGGAAVAQASPQQSTVPGSQPDAMQAQQSGTPSQDGLAGKNGKVHHDKNKAARPTPMTKGDAGPKSKTDSTPNENTSTDLPKKGKP